MHLDFFDNNILIVVFVFDVLVYYQGKLRITLYSKKMKVFNYLAVTAAPILTTVTSWHTLHSMCMLRLLLRCLQTRLSHFQPTVFPLKYQMLEITYKEYFQHLYDNILTHESIYQRGN